MNKIKLSLKTNQDVIGLVEKLSKEEDKFFLTTKNDYYKANARSFLGVMYFFMEHRNDTYLISELPIPESINKYRD